MISLLLASYFYSFTYANQVPFESTSNTYGIVKRFEVSESVLQIIQVSELERR